MHISLTDIGKKYNRDWIFRNINFDFEAGDACAILGTNGSGKSTLLQIISGRILPTTGTVTYGHHGRSVPAEDIFRYLSLSTPYQELIEEYTIPEMLNFHHKLKPLFSGTGETEFLEILAIPRIRNKHIRYFSSGMKQRLKLALAVLSDVPLLLLDEPCANLDAQGIQWYNDLMEAYRRDRLVVVCSNHQQEETAFCTEHITIDDFK